jgi:hypothetical protein
MDRREKRKIKGTSKRGYKWIFVFSLIKTIKLKRTKPRVALP